MLDVVYRVSGSVLEAGWKPSWRRYWWCGDVTHGAWERRLEVGARCKMLCM